MMMTRTLPSTFGTWETLNTQLLLILIFTIMESYRLPGLQLIPHSLFPQQRIIGQWLPTQRLENAFSSSQLSQPITRSRCPSLLKGSLPVWIVRVQPLSSLFNLRVSTLIQRRSLPLLFSPHILSSSLSPDVGQGLVSEIAWLPLGLDPDHWSRSNISLFSQQLHNELQLLIRCYPPRI